MLEEVSIRQRYAFEFLVERIVFVLGSRVRKPNASSSVRRPLAAESSSESLAVASTTAGGVEVVRLAAVALVVKRSWENLAVAAVMAGGVEIMRTSRGEEDCSVAGGEEKN